MKTLNAKIVAFVRSKVFFWLIIVLFVLQASWLALSARYPMAFDENFHMGIISVYAHQWSPLLLHQPPGPAPYGALTTDPSYLYHYLLSFPYRLLADHLSPQNVIVVLRLINVGFFTAALVLLRRLLLKITPSTAVVHVTLFFFTLIPIVPLLAGQINYDNLMILLLAINLLLVLFFREQLQKKRQCNAGFLLHLLSFGLLASLVKFAYLPILLAIIVYVSWIFWQVIGQPSKMWRSFLKNWRSLTRVNRTVALSLFLISLALFLQRYGWNTVKYHNPIPQCGQVVSVEQCQAYGPWARNYALAHTKSLSTGVNPLYFAGNWVYGMFYRSFFAINGPGPVANYDNRPPLPVLASTAVVIFGFGVYLVARYRRKIFGDNPALAFLLFVSGVYVAALIGRNFHDYVQLGQMVAINGRYLLPVILPVLLAMVLAYRQFLRKTQYLALLIIVGLLFLQGGGALSFIIDSNSNWYRFDSPIILQTNQRLQRAIKPFILNWPKID